MSDVRRGRGRASRDAVTTAVGLGAAVAGRVVSDSVVARAAVTAAEGAVVLPAAR